ncbi:helix-turn-helix domain-containing protein [Micromonospora haikouensis]|uniref:helix-turn-helix domain-containing protein n=1 Tax=Micromonospora haikouensis TaxID=686309 RepID=UPI0036827DB5
MNGLELLPVGRRVAYWRGRRQLSQQVFADRLGKSKSWVDKVERGVRSLDRVSTLHDIAAVLRIDAAVLLGRDTQPADVTGRVEGVEQVREALSTYDIAVGHSVTNRAVVPADQLARDAAHTWVSFQYARYARVTAMVPELLAGAQRAHADDPEQARATLVEAYRVTASLLTKLGEAELAWLAADRAMLTATGDPILVAAATVQLGQALRAYGRTQAAVSTARVAAALDLGNAHEAVVSLAQIRNRLALTARKILRDHQPGSDGRCPICRTSGCTVAAAARDVIDTAEEVQQRRTATQPAIPDRDDPQHTG